MCRPHCWQYANPTGVEVPHRGHVIMLLPGGAETICGVPPGMGGNIPGAVDGSEPGEPNTLGGEPPGLMPGATNTPGGGPIGFVGGGGSGAGIGGDIDGTAICVAAMPGAPPIPCA
jgi:hypothetical protein